MEQRAFGKTGLKVSVLGFGCGTIGGLMVRGAQSDQERAVARAVDLGINYFDTAPMYGDTQSETNLGHVLARLRPTAYVATKVSVDAPDDAGIARAIARSVEASLRRLRRERVDVLQLHTPVTLAGGAGSLSVASVVAGVIPAFETLRQQGKAGAFGFSGTGEAAALFPLIDTGAFDVAQLIYNLLNPSAGNAAPGAAGPDYANVLGHAHDAGMGAVAIRVLAAGALSEARERHPLSPPAPRPMGSGADYASDVERAMQLLPLVSEGHAATLAEAAVRFAISHPAVSTALVGFSDLAQVEAAAAAVEKGPLPPATLARIAELLP